MMLTVSPGDTDCVITLLRAGADLDLKDNEGNAPLHVAVRQNQLQLVKVSGQTCRILWCTANLSASFLSKQELIFGFLMADPSIAIISPGTSSQRAEEEYARRSLQLIVKRPLGKSIRDNEVPC